MTSQLKNLENNVRDLELKCERVAESDLAAAQEELSAAEAELEDFEAELVARQAALALASGRDEAKRKRDITNLLKSLANGFGEAEPVPSSQDDLAEFVRVTRRNERNKTATLIARVLVDALLLEVDSDDQDNAMGDLRHFVAIAYKARKNS